MFIKRKKDATDNPWGAREKHRSRPSPDQEGDLGVRLRSEMLPASQMSARLKAYPKPIFTRRRMITLLFVFTLAGLGWYFGLGPGRPALERLLTTLIDLAEQATAPTSTSRMSDTPAPSTETVTPSLTITLLPKVSATQTRPSYTATFTATNTSESTCRDFSTVTLDDVGLEMCVQGEVIEVVRHDKYTLILFSYEDGAFYLVSYVVAWPDGTVGTCYQTIGEIQYLDNNPVLVFDNLNLPTECP